MAAPQAVYTPTIWALESLMILENSHVAAMLVHRDFDDEVAQAGDTINTRKPTKFSVNTMSNSAGATLNVQSVDATNVQVTLDQHQHVAWRLSDRDMGTAIKNLVEEFLEPSVSPMAEKIDSDLLGTSGLTSAGIAVVNPGAASLAFGDFATVRGKLREQQCPFTRMNGVSPVHMILGTQHETEALKITELVQANTSGNSPPPLTTGFINTIFGMNIFADQTVPTGSTTTDYQSVAFHRNAVTLVTRPLESPPTDLGVRSAVVQRDGFGLRVIMSYDHLRLGWLVSLDILYGFKLLDANLAAVLGDI